MRAGSLREKITIQEQDNAPDSYGQAIKNNDALWTDVATVWAGVNTLTGKEYLLGPRKEATATHKVFIRWLTGVTPRMRVLWGTRKLNIDYIQEDRQHARMMILMCTETKGG